MGKEKNSLTPLKEVITNLFADDSLPFNIDDAHIWKIWDEVVGLSIANNARPLWIKDRRLRVMVSDPIWLQELKFSEQDIRENLNKRLDRKAVKKIEFRVGSQ